VDRRSCEASHGIRVGPDGNIWGVDVKGHAILKFSPAGRVLVVIAQPYAREGNNETKDGFNEPTGLAFGSNGDFFVSDGYKNSRVRQLQQGRRVHRPMGQEGYS